MTFLFYLLAIAPIIFEFYTFYCTERMYGFYKKYVVEAKTNPTITPMIFTIFMWFYVIWNIVGLFSSQWILFLSILLISLIPKRKQWIMKIDAFVALCILVFIILNRYHLHIDLCESLKNVL